MSTPHISPDKIREIANDFVGHKIMSVRVREPYMAEPTILDTLREKSLKPLDNKLANYSSDLTEQQVDDVLKDYKKELSNLDATGFDSTALSTVVSGIRDNLDSLAQSKRTQQAYQTCVEAIEATMLAALKRDLSHLSSDLDVIDSDPYIIIETLPASYNDLYERTLDYISELGVEHFDNVAGDLCRSFIQAIPENRTGKADDEELTPDEAVEFFRDYSKVPLIDEFLTIPFSFVNEFSYIFEGDGAIANYDSYHREIDNLAELRGMSRKDMGSNHVNRAIVQARTDAINDAFVTMSEDVDSLKDEIKHALVN